LIGDAQAKNGMLCARCCRVGHVQKFLLSMQCCRHGGDAGVVHRHVALFVQEVDRLLGFTIVEEA